MVRTLTNIIVGALMGWVFIGATCEFDSPLGTASLGGPVETLHATQTLDHSPRWGPDGQYVVASIYRDYYRRSVYLAAADGSAVRRVFIDTDGTQASPSITSDGRIVFLEYVYKPRSGFVDGPSTPHYEAVGVANPDGTIQSEIPLPAFKVVGESGEMEAARFNHPSILPGTNRIVAMVSYRWIDGDAGIHEVVAPGNTRLLSATAGSSVLGCVDKFSIDPGNQVFNRLDGSIGRCLQANTFFHISSSLRSKLRP
ncbi:MAG: hypothetical protein OXF79_14735 [Chloroflexi bacterium]|nr:hypothetical protein [Chloroflexota bacterium]